jgi:hypothetical protein
VEQDEQLRVGVAVGEGRRLPDEVSGPGEAGPPVEEEDARRMLEERGREADRLAAKACADGLGSPKDRGVGPPLSTVREREGRGLGLAHFEEESLRAVEVP